MPSSFLYLKLYFTTFELLLFSNSLVYFLNCFELGTSWQDKSTHIKLQ